LYRPEGGIEGRKGVGRVTEKKLQKRLQKGGPGKGESGTRGVLNVK